MIVEAVEIEPGGKFHVSGRARAGAAVRLYLNDSFVAPVTAGADGRFAVTINEGVAPGSYRVRVDELESNSSAVRARAEVPFNVPDQAVTGTVTAQAAASQANGHCRCQPAAIGGRRRDCRVGRRLALRRGRAEDRDHHGLPWRHPLAPQPSHLWRGHALCHDLQGETSSRSAIPTSSIPARSLSCLPRKHALSGASARKVASPCQSVWRPSCRRDGPERSLPYVRSRTENISNLEDTSVGPRPIWKGISGDRKAFFGCDYLFSAMAFKWTLLLLLFSKNGLRRTMNASRTLHGRPRTWSLTALWTNA